MQWVPAKADKTLLVSLTRAIFRKKLIVRNPCLHISLFLLPETKQILAQNHRDVLLRLAVKNAAGRNFDDVSSLRFDFRVSDETLLRATTKAPTVPEVPVGESGEFGRATHPGRAFQSFSPVGSSGPVDITATLVGYSEDVLRERKVKEQPVSQMVVVDDAPGFPPKRKPRPPLFDF